MYSPQVINLFANAENVGIIQSASGVGVYTNEKTNEVFKLYLKIENGYIVDVSFKAYTGVVGVAVMSIFTEMIKNISIVDAEKIEPQQILNSLEDVEKKYNYLASNAIETLQLALQDYKKKLERANAKR